MSRLISLLLVGSFGLAAVPGRPPASPASPAFDPDGAFSRSFATRPPAPDRQGDPADSLYRVAREELNAGNYRHAAELFGRIAEAYPKSGYAPDALYWQAFALYRNGEPGDLRAALRALERQRERYPKATTRGDADALVTRINGQLARAGDADAAESIAAAASAAVEAVRANVEVARAQAEAARAATEAAKAAMPQAMEAARQAMAATAAAMTGGRHGQLLPECAGQQDKLDTQIAALNALLQMDAAQAVPMLRDVLQRRDACSAPLRRQAVFLLAQKHDPETEDILLDLVRNDPDPGVREQAVFWLSQVPGPRSLQALEQVLATSSDRSLQEKALFALSQHGPEAAAALRRFAGNPSTPPDLREKAIFWLGQAADSPENAEFLRQLFRTTADATLKERILFSLSQMHGGMTGRFLADVATDRNQPLPVRKQALFWAGQAGQLSATDLARLYDGSTDEQMKQQVIFVLGQNREGIDKLIDIARNEKDPDLRSKAIFWLGQSRDPRAVKVLQEILAK